MNILLIIKSVLLIFIYLFLFLCFGMVVPSRIRGKDSLKILLLGFLIYFSLFEIIALPMKLLKLPLKTLTVTWFFILLGIVLFCLAFRRSDLKDMCKRVSVIWCQKIIIVYLIIAIGTGLLLGMNVNHISDYDASYYIGLPVSSVYSNTIELMDPNSGEMLEKPQHFYLMNTYVNHSAVMYQAFGVPPLVEQKFSMTVVLAFLFVTVLFCVGRYLFHNNLARSVLFTFLAVFILMNSYSLSNVSHYFAYRTYEGKSIVSYLVTSLIFLFFLALYYEGHSALGWTGLCFAAGCGATFCNTGLMLVPAMISIFVLPYIIFDKTRWRLLKYYLIVMIPSVVELILYKLF